MYLVKREIGTERHKKIEEKVDNEGFEQDGSRRIPTFSNRRIHPVFGPPLTVAAHARYMVTHNLRNVAGVESFGLEAVTPAQMLFKLQDNQ